MWQGQTLVLLSSFAEQKVELGKASGMNFELAVVVDTVNLLRMISAGWDATSVGKRFDDEAIG